MTDESSEAVPDAAREALAAAKSAAMDKVRDANRIRREQESSAAAVRRVEGRRVRRKSGDRTDWDHPLAFGDAIADLMAMRGWEGDVAVARVLADWPQLVGEDIAAKATPTALADGVLSLQAESTAWATQLRLLAPQLIERIGAQLGAGIVTSIVARGPAGPQSPAGSWKVRGGRGPRDTYG